MQRCEMRRWHRFLGGLFAWSDHEEWRRRGERCGSAGLVRVAAKVLPLVRSPVKAFKLWG